MSNFRQKLLNQCANCNSCFNDVSSAPIYKMLVYHNEVNVAEAWSIVNKISTENFQKAVISLESDISKKKSEDSQNDFSIEDLSVYSMCTQCAEILSEIYGAILVLDKMCRPNSIFHQIKNYIGVNERIHIPASSQVCVQSAPQSLLPPVVKIENEVCNASAGNGGLEINDQCNFNGNHEQIENFVDPTFVNLENPQMSTDNVEIDESIAEKDPLLNLETENSDSDEKLVVTYESAADLFPQLPNTDQSLEQAMDEEIPFAEPLLESEETMFETGDNLSTGSILSKSYSPYLGTPGLSGRNTTSDVKTIVDSLYIPCSLCKELLLQEKMAEHMLQTHNKTEEDLFQCEYCLKIFLSNYAVTSHVANFHAPEAGPVEKRTCTICDKVFVSEKAKMIHDRNRHPPIKHYSCEICKRSYACKAEMIDHSAVHSTERPFQCDECDKTFKRKKHLYYHKRSHRDEEMDRILFTCIDCGKVLRNTNSLKSHRARFHRPMSSST